MDEWIRLPIGGPKSGSQVRDLVAHIKASGRGYIIEGAQQVPLSEHTKALSLVYWLRTHATTRSDTKQMVRQATDALVSTAFSVRCASSALRLARCAKRWS